MTCFKMQNAESSGRFPPTQSDHTTRPKSSNKNQGSKKSPPYKKETLYCCEHIFFSSVPHEVTDGSGGFSCALLSEKTLQMMVIPGQTFFLNGSEHSRGHSCFYALGLGVAADKELWRWCPSDKGDKCFVSDLERMTDSWKIREMQM